MFLFSVNGPSCFFSPVLQNVLARYGNVISLLAHVACLHSIGAGVAFEEFTKLWSRKLWKSCLFEETHFDELILKCLKWAP